MTKTSAHLSAPALQTRFEGRVLEPGGGDYEAARRIWNGQIDRKPAVIVQCVNTTDVREAVKLARSEHLPLSVRGGGHGVAGNAVCQNGLMIDLSRMKDIHVDPARRVAVAQPGMLWGEFDGAAERHGLATTGGQVSHTGIAGLTLGGGLGFLMGKHGAVVDNLLSVELVTYEGEVVTASADRNPELFWGVRGAGANYGVATSFTYQLYPLAGVTAGMLVYPRVMAPDVLANYTAFLKTAPDELNTTVAFLVHPEAGPVVAIIVVYSGEQHDADGVLRPLRKFGPPIADTIQPMPYTASQQMADALVPAGDRYYWKASFLPDLKPELTEILKQGADAMASPYSMIALFQMNGKIRKVPADAMAFGHRDHAFEMSIISHWKDPSADGANVEWARDLWNAAQSHASPTVYANHLSVDEAGRVSSAYSGEKLIRLKALKRTWDPENLFRLNHNIPPE